MTLAQPRPDTADASGNPDGMSQKHPPDSRQKKAGKRRYDRHGLSKLKVAVKELGKRTVDGRTRVGKAIVTWKQDHIEALGGPDAVTPQQHTILDVAAITKMLHDSISPWLLEQAVNGTLVNRRSRAVIAAVKDRQALADALVRYMGVLGLERKARPAKTLAEVMAEIARDREEARETATGGDPASSPSGQSGRGSMAASGDVEAVQAEGESA